MEFIAALLQGSYFYLLTGQIIIVTGLFLSLVYFSIKKVQANSKLAVASAADNTSGMSSEALIEWQDKCRVLEEENRSLNEMGAEYKGLQGKVKFLESKLLEYEILQEEIGTLSTLKVENEKLKAELASVMSQFKNVSPTGNLAAAAVVAEVIAPVSEEVDLSATEPAPVAVIDEASPFPDLDALVQGETVVSEPVLEAAVEVPVPQIVEPVLDLSSELPVPPEPVELTGLSVSVNDELPVPNMDFTKEPSQATDTAADPGLEGLLQKIDELTLNLPK